MTGTCFFRGTGVNCTTELPLGAVIKWFNWLTCALHGNYVWLRFNISPVSSEHKGTQTGTTRARTQNCSLSLPSQKARDTRSANDHVWSGENSWIIWAKVNWSHPAVWLLKKAASRTMDAREQICLCARAPEHPPVDALCVDAMVSRKQFRLS